MPISSASSLDKTLKPLSTKGFQPPALAIDRIEPTYPALVNFPRKPFKLFEPFSHGALKLTNRTVMSPMTRSRAVDANTPNALMAEYYGQRASAGLIITEGTSPSPSGLGYPRIPGLYNQAQVAGWKLVTNPVHARGGKIFLQLMHTGRVTAAGNLPAGAEVVGSTAEVCPGEMYVDGKGMQPVSRHAGGAGRWQASGDF